MKSVIITDKILTPQKYLELMTGNYYILRADNQIEEIDGILDRELGEGSVWSYSLLDIPTEESEVKLVPVEIVYITGDCKQDKFCRLFQVPDDWDEEDISKML